MYIYFNNIKTSVFFPVWGRKKILADATYIHNFIDYLRAILD